MKKTLLSLLLAITMLVLLAVPTFAAGGNLSATATPSADGTSFTIDLIVNDNPGIIALTGKVIYDSKVVKLTSAKSGVVFENPFMTSQSLEVNPYQIIWMDATARKNNVTNGVLATYTFEVLKNAPNGESEIKFEIAEAVNRDKGDVTFTPCSFKINVKGTVSEEQSTPANSTTSGSNSSTTQNKIPNSQTIEVQKPLTDNTVSTESTTSKVENTESTTETDSSLLTIGGSSVPTASDYEDDFGEDGFEGSNNNRTVITIAVIAVVLALGLGVTATALYFRKKSGK